MPPRPAAAPADSVPAKGQVIGGRFRVERKVAEDALGVVLAATDVKTNRAIALRILPVGLVKDGDPTKLLKSECRIAAALQHRNIVATFGVGSARTGSHFIAREWVEGTPLSELIEKRRSTGAGQMSLRGAYNVVAHVCKALQAAHQTTCHGALRPGVVWVTRSGRVKVSDFGVGHAVVEAAGAVALGPTEQACLAPEVKAGGAPTQASDIFGVGAILYQMLTGKSPAEGFTPPSQAHPEATEAIDHVLLKCLAASPESRYGSASEIRQALLPLVADAPSAPAADDFGIEIDVDEALASHRPSGTRPVPPPQAKGPPRVGSRVSVHEPFRPSAPGAERPSMPRASEVDLKDVLSKITENDAPRWLVVKDRIDQGPFAGREIVDMIVKGEILEVHGLMNMDTGLRKAVGEYEEFAPFVAQYRIRKRDSDEKASLARSEQVEKASNLAKILVAAGVALALIGAVVLFVVTREAASTDEVADADLADLYERGDIEITGTAGILPGGRRGKRSGRRRSGMGGGGASGRSYEEAMNEAVNLGDVTMAGSERRLTSGDVAGVMNRHINSLFGCVSQELRRGGQLGNVQIDLAIAGNGSVMGASARQGSAAFKSCIAGRVRRIRFPSFSAPRMGARYAFSVD